jgi:coenzyme F420-reducing hydrogenase alpha subunit
MSAVHAIENAFGIKVGGSLRALRRLIYCGEWIESHTLHFAMLHAPDFLGYQDIVEMSKDYPDVVKTALRLKKVGNNIMKVLGGREIHPINIKIGGFYKTPAKKELLKLVEDIKWARDAVINLIKIIKTFEFPEFESEYEFVSLSHPDEYPMNEGKIISSRGINILPEEYDFHFVEEHAEHSNALHSGYGKRLLYGGASCKVQFKL